VRFGAGFGYIDDARATVVAALGELTCPTAYG